jgi:hypothetical protein
LDCSAFTFDCRSNAIRDFFALSETWKGIVLKTLKQADDDANNARQSQEFDYKKSLQGQPTFFKCISIIPLAVCKALERPRAMRWSPLSDNRKANKSAFMNKNESISD